MTRWHMTVAALVAAGSLAGCGSYEADSAGTQAAPDPSRLTVPAAPAGRCMAPNVDSLRAQDSAFEGVVTEVTDGSATLDVVHTYKGEAVSTVEVAVPDPDLRDLVLAVGFEQGQTYLVSSSDGEVSVCGLSGPKDDMLADLYAEAYAD